mmetsp:Transcript_16505/g.40327  ORF Transcript_16505/g.40327 Transcript_16505/m.40327 type:complete len:948 (-) Transcript_16505:607-3450(-)
MLRSLSSLRRELRQPILSSVSRNGARLGQPNPIRIRQLPTRHFSASGNAETSPREEHERRVAAAQALVEERRRKNQEKLLQTQQQTQQRKEEKRLARQKKHREHTVISAVSHWLAKDPSFFATTMDELNISSQSASLSTDPEATSNKNHPMQILWAQYKQLYYESIPAFREQMDGTARKIKFEFTEDIEALAEAGFGDPGWGKKYRQVRGYRVRNQDMTRQREKIEAELQGQRQLMRKAKAELAGLRQEVEMIQETQKRRLLEQKEAVKEALAPPKKDESFFSQALAMMSNVFSSKAEVDEETARSKRVEEIKARIKIPKTSRMENRMSRKAAAIEQQQREINLAATEAKRIKGRLNRRPPPMSDSEYERANKIVEQVRSSICGKLAKHIRQRHEKLILQFQTLDSKTDLTKPHEWYSYARLDRRKIIFHGGPTNSGKTYAALQRLKAAKQGLYLGPLRLLAAEIYETLTEDGIYTNLFTGQERREIPFSTHASATVEMCSTEDEYDVVVLDEIQMIADDARGAAWTKALMGLRCKEIHVCGGWEAKKIVQKIAKACGDEFEVHKYERFSKLNVGDQSLAVDPTKEGAYKNVRPGDCVVAFSRNDIFAIKREIETTTNYKCCVIYGKLPPQTRADQARLFNDPDSGYDILVASDAIGMGLNLNIRRIIFNSIFKFNGEEVIRLSHSDVKQISGRAGRRNSPYPNGEVSCRDPRDLQYIRGCMSTEIEPIEKAGLLPTTAHIELFSEALGAYNLDDDHSALHNVLRQFSAMATVRGDFFLCRQTEMKTIAKRLKDVPLLLTDAYTLCLSPTNENSMKILENFATKYAQGQVSGLPSRSVPKKAKSFDDLSYLCGLYADADLFLWLQMKFPPSNAVEAQTALARKEKTLEFINEALGNTERLKLNHSYIRQATRHRAVWEAENGNDGTGFENDDTVEDMYPQGEDSVYM